MSPVKIVVIAVVAAVIVVGATVFVHDRQHPGDASSKSNLAETLSGLAGKRAARTSDFAGAACATSQPNTLAVLAGGSCSVALQSSVGNVTVCSASAGAQVRMVGTDYPATVAKGADLTCPAGHELRIYDKRTVISFVCVSTAPCQFTLVGKAS
jgi:hypothetical protein